jgi:prophage DNA circulation protein
VANTAFDALQPVSFADFKFPASKITAKGGLRDHVHEYPHAQGGAPEKLGRKLYEFTLTCPFHNTFKKYPQLWPETLGSLRIFFENGATRDLVVPNIGTIPCYCFAWEETADGRVRSGVEVTMSFREDQSNAFLVEELIKTSAATFSSTVATFNATVADAGLTDIFSAIRNAAAQVTAIADQVELYGDILAAKVEGLSSLCQQADERLDLLNRPTNVRILNALHNLWASNVQLGKDVLKAAVPIIPFVVPAGALLSVADVSRSIYGDTSRAVELMKLNPIEDAFAIPGGTVLRAYAPAA